MIFNVGISNNKNNVSFGAKPIPKTVLKTFEQKLANVKTVDIYSHSSLDEDTINSTKVIYNWLKKLGKEVSICADTKETKGLFFKLSKHYKIKKDMTQKPDLSFLVDFNSLQRAPKDYLGSLKSNLNNLIGLDHHDSVSDTVLKKNAYIDNKSHSCSGIVYRFFEGLNVKLKKADLESLYCGMLSDYKKSKLISISSSPDGLKLNKLPKLYENKNSTEVLEKLESKLDQKSKAKILKHLDVLSNLSPKEKIFRESLSSRVQVTKNGELAYLIIEPNDKQWRALGMDNTRTSDIIADFRSRLITPENDACFSPELKNKLKKVKGAIIFYRNSEKADSSYKMSIHSKDDYAKRLIDGVKANLNPDLIAGGHADRAGGKVNSCQKSDVDKFINDFLTAAENLK